MKCIINGKEIKVKCDFSFMQVRRKNKNHENEYIVQSYIFSDKELLSYDKEKISDFITAMINKEE